MNDLASIRREIAAFERPGAIERAHDLLAAIKTETRWLLLKPAGERYGDIDAPCEFAAEDRRNFLRIFPDIRHRRIPASYMASFYDLVADQASTLAHLIEVRRARERNRKASQ
jgi:hypothetical protein